MNIIKPNNVPHTTDRFVVMTEGDLQRLRAIVADLITDFHNLASKGKTMAREYKQYGNKERAGELYKAVNALLVKANNLGRSQYALKHQSLTNTEVVQYFNEVGISLVETKTIDLYANSRSQAWMAVCDALDKATDFTWTNQEGTGIECAVKTIADLAAKAKANA